MSPAADLGRALCIITGASRGFGRALAQNVSRLVQPGSALVLVARSGPDLRTLQAELTESEAGRAGLKVEVVVADVGKAESLENIMRTCREAFCEDMDHVMLINNAASLGDVSKYVKDLSDMAQVDSYLSLNVSSALCLTARVLQAFPQHAGLRRSVVNVSSLCALQPFRSWGLYCTGKAAREMMFKVLAEEEPDLRVLSYSPAWPSRCATAVSVVRPICTDALSAGSPTTVTGPARRPAGRITGRSVQPSGGRARPPTTTSGKKTSRERKQRLLDAS
uniref:SET and MYND domain containing 1a n=1 Tax=Fundulus heteroclitus TaxID=8078 RepID=A0A3Q2QES5_FUNHE